MEMISLTSSGDGNKTSGSRRASRSTHLAAQRQVIDERQLTMASMSGGLSESEAIERRWTMLSLAYWRLNTRTEISVCLISVVALLMEVETLGGRGTWDCVRWGITVGPKVTWTLDERRG